MKALTLMVTLAVVAALARPTAAQQIERDDFAAWIDAVTIYRVTDKFRYDGDQGFRAVLTDTYWRVAYVRPSIRYEVRPWLRAHGGVGAFYAFLDAPSDLLEIRPWLGCAFIWPKPAGFVFGHYFRFEERFLNATQTGEWDSSFRARYQLSLTTPGFDVSGASGFFFRASGEAFENVTGSIRELFVNKFRVDAALGKTAGRSARVEIHYIYQSTRGSMGEDFALIEHILRVRLFFELTGS